MRSLATRFVIAAAATIFPACALVVPASPVAKANFQKYRPALPVDLDVVSAGGWNTLVKLSEDPKSELSTLIMQSLQSKDQKINYTESGKIDALVALLQSRGKGFDSDLVDGEWLAVLTRSGKKSPSLQKLVDKSEKAKRATSNFDVKEMTFENINYTPHGRGVFRGIVKYNPVAENFERSADGKGIVIRRIACDIIKATFKYWRLPRIPLPLRRKGGYLDFLYLDEDMRVTRGNRGGLFVHFRPAYLDKIMSEDYSI